MVSTRELRWLYWGAAGIAVAVLYLGGTSFHPKSTQDLVYRLLSFVLAGLLVLVVLFDNFIWHWPGVCRLVNRPDLRGTWRGETISSWKNPETGQPNPPIESYYSISQTFSTIQLRLMTAESTSTIVHGGIVTDASNVHTLVAAYHNTPDLEHQHRSRPHNGAVVLEVQAEKQDRLKGSYWTDRDTHGKLAFIRFTRERYNDFTTAKKHAAAAGRGPTAP